MTYLKKTKTLEKDPLVQKGAEYFTSSNLIDKLIPSLLLMINDADHF